MRQKWGIKESRGKMFISPVYFALYVLPEVKLFFDKYIKKKEGGTG